MGTRAIITKNGKPFIGTHFDGYPSSLGADLLKASTDEEISNVAEDHSIDFADMSILKGLNKARFAAIAKKANSNPNRKKDYTVEELEKLFYEEGKMLQFGLMASDDHPIGDIKDYDDWAEYQYDLTDGKWTCRELHGKWSETSKSTEKLVPIQEELDRLKKEEEED